MSKRAKAVPAKHFLDLLPTELLEQVSEESQVNRQVKHLEGRLMVLLLLQGILKDKDGSLRSLESLYNSPGFEYFSGKGKHKTRHSSLADRLANIELSFFERLYAEFLLNVNRVYGKKLEKEFGWLRRFDSTMVALSANLSEIGMRVGAKPGKGKGWNQIKFTVGLQGLIPTSARVFHEQTHLSEERALLQVIEESKVEKGEVAVFDMGLKSRKTFKQFAQQGLLFVTRLKSPRYEVVGEHKNIKGRHHGQLSFLSDQIIHLYKSGDGPVMTEVEYRLITAVCITGDNVGKTYYFLSNIMDLTAFEIADIYLKRWDIEIFFRFLKQQIGLRHLLAYNINGITAVFYVRLLTATMLQLFFFLNKRKDLGIAKMDFADQLQWEQFLTMAVLAGADPLKLKQQLGEYQGDISQNSS
ncbi:MAG: IS4 family transposase [Saprospiraceae bacterium]